MTPMYCSATARIPSGGFAAASAFPNDANLSARASMA
jgi:hypothetical protein